MRDLLLEIIEKHGWLVFSDSDGGCCCGDAYLGGVEIKVHCWRTHLYKDGNHCSCPYAGIHLTIRSEDVSKAFVKKLGNILKKDIEAGYRCECKVIIKSEVDR